MKNLKDLKKFEIATEDTKDVKGGPAGHPTDFYGTSYGGDNVQWERTTTIKFGF